MTLRERYDHFVKYFLENMPLPETELNYKNPFELIVAVILSAQCTDKRVNMITPELLERYPDPESMAEATQEEIFNYIRSCSYPNNKARHLSGMAKKLVKDYGGTVPSDTESLMTLPGVGRKTANVIASVAFMKPVMAVDTHVFRVSARIGLTVNARNPLEAEKQLTRNIEAELLHKAHHWLILHGRYICKARKPDCELCGLKGFCRYFKMNKKPGRGSN